MTGLNITLDNETLKELMLGRGKHVIIAFFLTGKAYKSIIHSHDNFFLIHNLLLL